MPHPKGRDGLGGEQVEGRRAVLELLRAGRRPVRTVFVSSSARDDASLDEIRELAGAALKVVGAERIDGLVPVGRHLAGLGATSLWVALLEEAVALREAGVTLPILVMGGILGHQIPIFLRHGLTLTASSIDKLRNRSRLNASTQKLASTLP